LSPRGEPDTLGVVPPSPSVPPELTRGPFTLIEAASAGLTRRQLGGASWRRLGAGLYVWTGLAPNPALAVLAASRRLPDGAAFSGLTAAWLHRLDLQPCDPIEVTIPPERGISVRAGMAVRRAMLSTGDIVARRGLPVTSPLRTVVDLASTLPLVEAVVAADGAVRRRLISVADLEAYAADRGRRRGAARARRVIELVEPLSESPMETRLRLLLVLGGLPRPLAQVSLHDEHGRFVGRPDLYYPGARLGIEYDGGTHRDSLVEDDRRQNRLLNAGFRLLRFTAADLRQPSVVVAQVTAALISGPTGAAPGSPPGRTTPAGRTRPAGSPAGRRPGS